MESVHGLSFVNCKGVTAMCYIMQLNVRTLSSEVQLTCLLMPIKHILNLPYNAFLSPFYIEISPKTIEVADFLTLTMTDLWSYCSFFYGKHNTELHILTSCSHYQIFLNSLRLSKNFYVNLKWKHDIFFLLVFRRWSNHGW